MELEIKDEVLEQYKNERIVHKQLQNRKIELGKTTKSLHRGIYRVLAYGLVWVPVFILTFLISRNFVSSIFISLYVALFPFAFVEDSLVNFFSGGKIKQVKLQIEEVRKQITESEDRLRPIEKDIEDSIGSQLENFFNERLFKKRSGTAEFEESYLEFESMVDEAMKFNSILFSSRVNLWEYKNYLAKRKFSHSLLLAKKTHKSDRIQGLVESLTKPIQPKMVAPLPPEKLYRHGAKNLNWDEINKNRRLTGLKGEQIAVILEQDYLNSINRSDLANKVRHVSVEDGDGYGYDVLSFFDNGLNKYIEVKGTTASIDSPFYISSNELRFLHEHSDDSFVYRILTTSDAINEKSIRVHSSDDVLKMFDIIPTQYVVRSK